jgi:hypothetical protein
VLGFEQTTYGYNFRPMINFHWGAGRLSRGIDNVGIWGFRVLGLWDLGIQDIPGRFCAKGFRF